MKRRSILEAMKSHVTTTLEGALCTLISIGIDTSVDKETGEITKFVKAEAEVPKGFDAMSRCRFSVKIANSELAVTDKQLDEGDYTISFKGLSISYIDTKGNVYFRADSYEVNSID